MTNSTQYIDLDGIRIPLNIIVERRHNTRAALGTKNVILRIPQTAFLKIDVEKHVHWVKDWLNKLKTEKPHVLDKYISVKRYADGEAFAIGGKSFVLNIERCISDKGYVKLKDDKILHLKLPLRPGYDEQSLIKKLLIKFSQNYFLPYMIEKVNKYNLQYFKQPVKGVRLKYNKSNWGSCSTGSNLNFSVRLLFADDDVIDYVVIHELAHLLEMNHSDKFWALVENVMPDYKEKELILKKASARFDF
ncbi:MAG: M48 family metallopeptidase [Saprospiraceae bacterium]|nr:M48 family metallopeptidase [Saprospiraceae bacterium]